MGKRWKEKGEWDWNCEFKIKQGKTGWGRYISATVPEPKIMFG